MTTAKTLTRTVVATLLLVAVAACSSVPTTQVAQYPAADPFQYTQGN